MFKFNNGDEVKDKITGFKGVVTSRVDYLTGCRQYGLTSKKLDKDGREQKIQWFDEDRLENTHKKIKLKRNNKGGMNMPHPGD